MHQSKMAGSSSHNVFSSARAKVRNNSLLEMFIASFSHEWRDLIRMFLLFENPCEKAERWLQKRCFADAVTLGPTTASYPQFANNTKIEGLPVPNWHELIADLIEKVPLLLNHCSITSKERILYLPANSLKNLLMFIGCNKEKMDGNIFDQLCSFLHCNMQRFDGWCRLVIGKRFSPQSNLNVSKKGSLNENQKNCGNFGGRCLTEGKHDIVKLTNTAKDYLNLQDGSGDLMPWKIFGHFNEEVINSMEDEKEEVNEMLMEIGKSREIDSIDLPKASLDTQEPVVEGTHPKKAKLELDIEFENEIDKDKTRVEGINCTVTPPLRSTAPSFRELMEKYPDFKLICTELNTIFSKPFTEIDHICSCLEIDDLTEGQFLYFLSCICSGEAAMQSLSKSFILRRSLLTRLINLEKIASRQLYNSVVQLLDYRSKNRKECMQSVIVPLVLQSTKNSPQEDLILRILKSDALGSNGHCEILQSAIELYKEEKEMSKSFVKTVEIILERRVKIPSRLLFDIFCILRENSAKFEDMVEVPKLVISMIKQYKKDAAEMAGTLQELLCSNKSFLAKKAHKELAKI